MGGNNVKKYKDGVTVQPFLGLKNGQKMVVYGGIMPEVVIVSRARKVSTMVFVVRQV